jgi:pimeloyl-ACP methyl ester carboxylesterase
MQPSVPVSSDGAPVPVVLLHGQPGSSRDWDQVRPLLTEMTLLVPNRPGYDGTPAGGFWHNADALVRRLDDAGVDRAIVVGHSWSGGAALATALQAPARVAALVLVASVGTRSAYGWMDRVIATKVGGYGFTAVMRGLGPRMTATSVRSSGSRLGPAELAMVRERLRQSQRSAAWQSFRVEQAAMLRETPELERRLGDIEAPAIVLAGTRDRSVPREACAELADRLPNAVLREVDAGHLIPLEQPAAVATAVVEATRRAGAHRPGA